VATISAKKRADDEAFVTRSRLGRLPGAGGGPGPTKGKYHGSKYNFRLHP